MRSRAASMSLNVITRFSLYRARNSGNVFTSIRKESSRGKIGLESSPCGLRQRVCLQSVGRFDNLIAEVAKNADRNVAHADVVLEHENSLSASRQFLCARFFVRWCRWR